jgi:predicted thioesterase
MADAVLTFTVSEQDTARALGSGELDVLATPRLLAWCEAATCAAAAQLLDDADSTTVGTKVALDHVAASPVGAVVRVSATVVHHEGRSLWFAVMAADGPGGDHVLATGEVHRAIVDRRRFLDRLHRAQH